MEDLKKNWEKSGLTDLLAPRCKTYVRYKGNFKGSRCKQRLFQPFVIVLLSKKQIWHCFCQVDTIWTWGWSIYRATIRNWCQRRKWFVTHIKFMTMEIDVLQLFLGDFPDKKKFDITWVRLILRKVRVDRFTEPQHETDVRYEFCSLVILR